MNLEEEEILGDLRNDGNGSMLEQVKIPNPWKTTMMDPCAFYLPLSKMFN
jgi:hypothetical protein